VTLTRGVVRVPGSAGADVTDGSRWTGSARLRHLLARTGRAGLRAAAGLAIVIGSWWLLAFVFVDGLPGPVSTAAALRELSESSAGSGFAGSTAAIALALSLQKAAIGFLLGAAAALPLGLSMGTNRYARAVLGSVSAILTPISPVVWLPTALVASQAMGGASGATIFTVAIASLWPMMLGTAHGVGSLPVRYREVARAFEFERDRFNTKVLLPYALPHLLAAARTSVGIAWLAVIAAEMLTGESGIGSLAWERYLVGDVDEMAAALLVVASVGVVLDRAILLLIRVFDHT
jgi:nitrate/nitrite transport system permease protein